MNNRKFYSALLAGSLAFAVILSGCGNEATEEPEAPAEPQVEEPAAPETPAEPEAPAAPAYDEKYAVKDITLCATDTNDADFMKGFSIQGTGAEIASNEDVFSVAMCYTTANADEVKAFFTSDRFSDPASFLAEIDALDMNGNIRNLAGDKLSYLDGNTEDPIRYYGDGIDLINEVSLLQNAGEYHFYMVTMGYEQVLWVGEADRTFVMEQAAIDQANAFAAAYEKVVETRLMADADVSALTQEEKTAAALDYFTKEIDALNLGITVDLEYDNNEEYPDDYVVTLTLGEAVSSDYVTVFFGPEA